MPATAPATTPGRGCARRILIVTADMGSGHREVAAELGRRFVAAGARCHTVDIVSATGAAGRRLQTTYRRLLRTAPWVYDAAMRAWLRHPAPLEHFVAHRAEPFDRMLADEIAKTEPDVVVSTYNLAGQSLGRLRRDGRIGSRLVTFVTDPGAHPYWVSPHVDLHVAPLPTTGALLADFGAPAVQVAAPALRPEFTDPPDRDEARAELGLPDDTRLALVTAGSWAAGRVGRTVDLVRRSGDVTALVLCGHDAELYRRLQGRTGVVAVPWNRRIVNYLAAADVVIDNAGGLTCWEALSCRRPVLLFDPLPGHGRLNAQALADAGLVGRPRSPGQLLEQLRRPPGPPALPDAPDPAQVIDPPVPAVRG